MSCHLVSESRNIYFHILICTNAAKVLDTLEASCCYPKIKHIFPGINIFLMTFGCTYSNIKLVLDRTGGTDAKPESFFISVRLGMTYW